MRRLLFIVVLGLAALLGKWVLWNFVGVALTTYGQGEEARDAAATFAPANAEVLAARGRFLLNQSAPPRVAEAIRSFQRAVAASPRDFRYWLELGRAYESNNEPSRAEACLQRAVELAPAYFEPRWLLANLRLRAGRTDQALDDFSAAIRLSGGSSPQPDQAAAFNAFTAVAQALGQNLEALRRVAGTDSVALTYLASFLATNQSLDAALDLWRRLPQRDLLTYRSLIFQLLHLTQVAGRFDDEREVWRRLESLEGVAESERENRRNLITNQGLERAPMSERYWLLADPPTGFDWVIRPHTEVRARRVQANAHSGAYALHLTFATPMRSEFREVTQLIAVEPLKAYQLSYFVKTERMPMAAPFVELVDAARPEFFALRSIAPSGTNDWREVTLGFTTPPGTRGLRLAICSPVLREFNSSHVGELWFDDFKLEKAE